MQNVLHATAPPIATVAAVPLNGAATSCAVPLVGMAPLGVPLRMAQPATVYEGGQQVDNRGAGGYFARFGESPERRRSAHEGRHSSGTQRFYR